MNFEAKKHPYKVDDFKKKFIATFRGRLLVQIFASSGCGRCLLQNEVRSGSRPRAFPRLCKMRSGTSTERFRSSLELAGSWGSRQDVMKRLICGFPSHWTLETTFLWPFPRFCQKFSLLVIWDYSIFVPYCF